ncbi:hypothetical protein C0Q70_01540 [Pomacea canaliculata]|uniref:Annexin n=1 Tax=Pomacea canaliculata TaxID=400727 RepID=A0A2T7PZR1_POMCA|nr:annexin-B12-like [Pomacea canaliculata]PVD38915.1 hypothetical protein C0Q70_01540 [Pomacea canaliculata]
MSYPPYGPPSGFPPAPGGYPAPGGQPGYPGYPGAGPGYGGFPASGGQFSMPTPESASAAAYGGPPGGMPSYPPQPGGLGFGAQAGGAYPPAPSVAMPNAPNAACPTYSQPTYGGAPGFGGPQPGSYPAQPVTGYSQPSAGYGSSAGYPSAPAAGQYGAGQPGYGPPPTGSYGGSYPGTYGAPGVGPAVGQHGVGGQYGQSTGYQSVPAATTYKIMEEGTLKPFPRFNAEEDVQKLRKAMKGIGTDEKAIIDILGYRTNDQRQNIKLMYKTCYGRDLVQDLKSELGGHFEDAAVALMFKPDEYDAYELRRAMRGAGTDEAALIEILCTRSNSQIHTINNTYKMMYGRKLEEDIISETSGHFRKLLVSMSVGGRMENQPVDMQKAQADAQKVYNAGERRWGTDENTFNMVLASQSYEQLRAVFDAYSRIANKDIEQAIQSEMSGDLATGMLTIVRMIRNKHGYFADRLYHSMKGMGTDDRTLIRIIVSRCEVDMKQIKLEFQRRYGQTLDAFVRDDISGDYRRLILALVGGSI